ncbi:homocysteine methyltransferase [Jannaschia sp. EhC01]|nr:homocysteine methyltransferase [Jannaschia sp. EhC01]
MRGLPATPGLFLAYLGMETDLIFTHGQELPGFASFPMVETPAGRALLRRYYDDMIALGRRSGHGVILESPTWVANRDRAAPLDYGPEHLAQINRDAVAGMAEAKAGAPDVPLCLSLNIGPRSDAYAPDAQMTVPEAEAYHAEQIAAVAQKPPDMVSAYTLAYAAEAIGIARAARAHDLPVVIAFTVERDGRLPTGMTLPDAITQVDAKTDGYPAYYMVNCAHPDHFADTLHAAPWMDRIGGLVANASRCSHAELDNAETLDDGNPEELGQQLSALRQRFTQIRVLGGCCGTDMRHMAAIATACPQGQA